MAFEPSYNILDKDTHNMVVEAFKSGGIGYTEADGTVHKISGDYVEGGGGGGTGYDAILSLSSGQGMVPVITVEGDYDTVFGKLSDGKAVSVLVCGVANGACQNYLTTAISASIQGDPTGGIDIEVIGFMGASQEMMVMDMWFWWGSDGTATFNPSGMKTYVIPAENAQQPPDDGAQSVQPVNA